MIKDWVEWHRHYDSPESPLTQRLIATQREFRRALSVAPCDNDGVVRVVSICAGEGRDVLPVLSSKDHGRSVRAILVELNEQVASRARANAISMGLDSSEIEIRMADAGDIISFCDAIPVHIIVASGVFGNISMTDVRNTIDIFGKILESGGLVVWTRSSRAIGSDRSLEIRANFLQSGFEEMGFTATPDSTFRIGLHKYNAQSGHRGKMHHKGRMFTFSADKIDDATM